MADEYGVPRSQKESALRDVNKKYKEAQARYRGARTQAERNRAEADLRGAEEMRKRVTNWGTG